MILQEVHQCSHHGSSLHVASLFLGFRHFRALLWFLVKFQIAVDALPCRQTSLDGCLDGCIRRHIHRVAVVAEETHVRCLCHDGSRLLVEARQTATIHEDGIALQVLGVGVDVLAFSILVQVRLQGFQNLGVVSFAKFEELAKLILVVVKSAIY